MDLIVRQVPKYLIIGNGRVARHMACYFGLLGIPHTFWHRGMAEHVLTSHVRAATHILLLIRDDAIADFAQFHLADAHAIKIHFSGVLNVDGVYGAHPLMTFGPDLYTQEKYQEIPFVVEQGAPEFADLLPGLPNPHTTIAKEDKAKYHTLCAMAGNFSCLLWQKLMHDFEHEFGLPAETAQAFLRQQTENLISDYKSALTGPLARGDHATLSKHLHALKDDPFGEVYQSFINAYRAQDNGSQEEK